jgi:deazaflavin-dependent oxidoreductase (nitroreductase family)
VPLPSRLARFNRRVTNRVSIHVVGHVPGFGIVAHQGRRSGRTYRTPVNVFRHRGDGPGAWVFALIYGRGDWVRNVEAAGTAGLLTRGTEHRLVDPRVVHDPSRAYVPAPVRAILGVIGVEDFLLADEAPTAGPGAPAEGR